MHSCYIVALCRKILAPEYIYGYCTCMYMSIATDYNCYFLNNTYIHTLVFNCSVLLWLRGLFSKCKFSQASVVLQTPQLPLSLTGRATVCTGNAWRHFHRATTGSSCCIVTVAVSYQRTRNRRWQRPKAESEANRIHHDVMQHTIDGILLILHFALIMLNCWWTNTIVAF